MPTPQPEPFATTLKTLRVAKPMTLQELGELSGMSRQRVHQLEAGTHQPSWREVQAIATALGVPTDTFRDS